MKRLYQGKEVDCKEVGVLTSSEPWNEYQLENGKVLRIKTVLIEVDEALIEKAPDGQPLYLTQTNTIVKVKT